MTMIMPIEGADGIRDDDELHGRPASGRIGLEGGRVMDGGNGIAALAFGFHPLGIAPHLATEASLAAPQTTSGNDFVHVAGDGLVAPGGYTDDPSATAGDDSIDISQGGNDEIFSGAGNDAIHAGAALTGADIIDGGADADTLYLDGDYAGAHALTLSNISNIEALNFAAGHSYTLTAADAAVGAGQLLAIDATGLAAADTLIFDGSAEMDGKFDIDSGAGNDTLTGGAGNDTFRGQDGNDTISGGDGNDIVIGNAGNDILSGGNNDDRMFGGAGNDTIDGGAGFDVLDSQSDTQGFTANMATGIASGAGIGNDTFTGIEQIQGGSGNDVLTGDGNANQLYGNGGSNTLSGAGGNDQLYDTGTSGSFDGGSGSDFLYLDRTALGANTIHFTSGSTTAQTLSDGTSIVNVETLALFSGSGDDTLTYTFGASHPGPDDSGAGTWDAGGGNDSMTIDVSAFDTPVQAYYAGSYYTVGDKQGIFFIYGYNVERIHVLAGSGNDFFNGQPGNDSFDGGAGIDTAGVYHGHHTDYAITYDSGTQSFTIADQRVAPADPDGIDTIKNTELFQFTDGVFTFDTQGRVTSQTVSDGGSGADMTVTDVAGTAAWSTQVVHTVLGSLASQTVTTDAGAQWVNTYDQAGTQSWTWISDSYDDAHNHLTQTGTNDDGTHWLTLWAPAVQYGYNDITLTFDANWNQTGVSGNNGGVPLTMASIAPVLDTVLWFTTPYDPDFSGPAAGGYGLGGAGMNGSGGLVDFGGPGIDILYGFGGDDRLEGGGGNDYLNGGTGNDTLVGGTGDDRFVFKFGDGLDTIRDFTPGNASGDVIDLHGYGVTSFAALTPFMSQVGADTLIAFDDQNHILLHNVTMTQLNAGDFVLS